ncbi:phosphatase PAP2 family protein [Streptomyces sp. NPDC001635]|nr:hypothetical protein E4K10_43910 [Streptomyces sp. T1317-0309]
MQQPVVDEHTLLRPLNRIYVFGHRPVIALTLIWLLTRHPALYVRAAVAMLMSKTAGRIAFAAFPAAPQRQSPDTCRHRNAAQG